MQLKIVKVDDYQPRDQLNKLYQVGSITSDNVDAIDAFSMKIHCGQKVCGVIPTSLGIVG